MSIKGSGNEHKNMNSKNYVCKQASAHSKTFFKRLILRKEMGLLKVEIDQQNRLNPTVTPIQMIGIGLGNIIGA